MSDANDRLLTKTEVANRLPCAERTVDRYRFRKQNPLPFIALTRGSIRFLESDVEKWIRSNRVGEAS